MDNPHFEHNSFSIIVLKDEGLIIKQDQEQISICVFISCN
jgi:hypothetical protein